MGSLRSTGMIINLLPAIQNLSYASIKQHPEICRSPSTTGVELANRLMSLWPIHTPYKMPFMYIDIPMVRLEGVKLPNDRRYLQAMLQVNSLA